MIDLWTPPKAPWTARTEHLAVAAGDLLEQIAKAHPKAGLATSLQIESTVLIDILHKRDLPIALFTLDTGMLPPETFEAIASIEARYGRPIEVFGPDPEEEKQWVAGHGAHAFYESNELRLSCCELRKVRPMKRALAGRTAWITGQRRDQAQSRADLGERQRDGAHGVEKFNPLAQWTHYDVWAYARRHDVPINPLYARGYSSIGCAPCTRAVRAHEDLRAGRWWWEQNDAKECGLHVVGATNFEI